MFVVSLHDQLQRLMQADWGHLERFLLANAHFSGSSRWLEFPLEFYLSTYDLEGSVYLSTYDLEGSVDK